MFASTACAPTMTLFTRAIIAKMAESAMSVVEMPASANATAVARPSPSGSVYHGGVEGGGKGLG